MAQSSNSSSERAPQGEPQGNNMPGDKGQGVTGADQPPVDFATAGADAESFAADSKESAAGSNAQDDIITAAYEVLDGVEMDSASDLSNDEQVAQAKAEAAEWQDKFMRLHAEWDTYRRRTTEQRQVEKARAAEKLVSSLLPVIDDLERTLDYAVKNGEQGLLEGVAAVRTKFVDVLVKDGVEVIDPKGAEFDALEAQAVATVEDAGVPDETVAEVYQKGYKMGAKVLRPAMVTVTSGGPKREKPQDGE